MSEGQGETLCAGTLTLRRAGAADRTAVEALQRAAYARNRQLLGLEPLPLLVDYAHVFATMEVWVADDSGGIAGALILEPQADCLLIWSISSMPDSQGKGRGRALLAAAETRARELGHTTMRLYTGATLTHLVDWYGRHGYAIERIEELPDRRVTHMVKELRPLPGGAGLRPGSPEARGGDR